MVSNGSLKVANIIARDLDDAWHQCLRECMDYGSVYTITRGSHCGQQRREFDSVTLQVRFPGTRPLVPIVPDSVPPPSTQDYVEQYLPYLLCGGKKQAHEQYTYGDDIERQLPHIIEMLRQEGEGTNQACMAIGSAASILLPDPQCLRVTDARVRYGKLHFYVYFRSWDLWGGFPSNLAAIQILKEYVASEIGYEDGELIAYSKGLHLYDHHWPLANIVLRRDNGEQHPKG